MRSTDRYGVYFQDGNGKKSLLSSGAQPMYVARKFAAKKLKSLREVFELSCGYYLVGSVYENGKASIENKQTGHKVTVSIGIFGDGGES